MNSRIWLTIPLLILLLISGCDSKSTVAGPDPDPDPDPNGPVRYANQVQPILTQRCVSCHGGGSQNFSNYNTLMASTSPQYGSNVVVAGNAANSPLYDKLLPNPKFGSRMPQGSSLTNAQIDLIGRWINEGAQNN